MFGFQHKVIKPDNMKDIVDNVCNKCLVHFFAPLQSAYLNRI